MQAGAVVVEVKNDEIGHVSMQTTDANAKHIEELLASIRDIHGKVIDFYQNADSILAILDKMGDEQSKINYRNELVTLVLQSVSQSFLEKFGFTMSSDAITARYAGIVAEDFPTLDFPEYWNYSDKSVGYNFVYPQYEYEDKVCLKEGDVFLDCGSCGGEVALWAQSKVGPTGKVVAFEPHPKTFEIMKGNLKKYAPNVKVKQAAIGNKSGHINFSDDAAPWSTISEQSTLQVPIIRIDDFCATSKLVPTFIKMDIEGAEIDALLGARQTIADHLPNLAICTYHKPGHLYQVGATISSISDRYTFYFRKNHPKWEAVLYATSC